MAQSSPVPAHQRTKHVEAYTLYSALVESHTLTQDPGCTDLAKGQKSLTMFESEFGAIQQSTHLKFYSEWKISGVFMPLVSKISIKCKRR